MMATTTAKNAISLEEQNNNFARASHISLPSSDVIWPKFKSTWERERQGDKSKHLSAVPARQFQKKKTSLNLISFFQVTVLLGIRRKTFGRCKVDFSATFPLASPSSDRHVSINIKAYPICDAYRVTHLLRKIKRIDLLCFRITC